MHAVESSAWDDWDEKGDPFEDALIEAERKEGRRLCDAVDNIRSFMEHDLWNRTFASPEEIDEVRFIFDALVMEAHNRFREYRSKLCAIEETHGHA